MPPHPVFLGLIFLIILDEEYKSISSFLHPPVISSLFGPNILLSALFSNTLSLFLCLKIGDQVSQPYREIHKTQDSLKSGIT
jgi:hypothetical protein